MPPQPAVSINQIKSGDPFVLQTVEDKFIQVSDAGVRARLIHEYKTIRNSVGNLANWQSCRILDFGCGQGIAAASFAIRHSQSQVYGADVVTPSNNYIAQLFGRQLDLAVPANLEINLMTAGSLPPHIRNIDLAYAWSVFEHINFTDLTTHMKLVYERLNANGVFFLQIKPLYYSPQGSHLYRYDGTPWVHLLVQHDALKAIVEASPAANAETRAREWHQYETLNRATADDIVAAAIAAQFKVHTELRRTTQLIPCQRLTRTFTLEALTTEEIQLVLCK